MKPVADVPAKVFLTKIGLKEDFLKFDTMHAYSASLLRCRNKSTEDVSADTRKMIYIIERCQACSVEELNKLWFDMLTAVAKTIRFTALVMLCKNHCAYTSVDQYKFAASVSVLPLFRDTKNPDLLSTYDKAKYSLLFSARRCNLSQLVMDVWRMGVSYREKGFKAMHRVLRKLGNPFKKGE